MRTFHHGGRIGDLVYALWTVKALGGGDLVISDFHHPNWSLDIARSMESFLKYQSYINDVHFVPFKELNLAAIDYDLHAAEDDYNPEAFGMTRDEPWPGRALIAGRYAKHFGLEFDGVAWLTAPVDESIDPVAFHAPFYRMVRPWQDWIVIAEKLIAMTEVLWPPNEKIGLELMKTATVINSARIFLGAVSCGHALAEGLGKKRLVEQASDCFNVGEPTVRLNGLSNEEVVAAVRRYL